MSDFLSALSCSLVLLCVGCASTPSAGAPSLPAPTSGVGAPAAPAVTASSSAAATATAPDAASDSSPAPQEGPEEASSKSEGETEAGAEEPSSYGDTATSSVPPGGSSGAMTPEEKTSVLDQELDESLREFDDLLTREQKVQEARREAASGAPGGGGYGGSGGGSGSYAEQSGRAAGESDGSESGSEASGDPSYSGGGAVGGPDRGDRQADADPGEQERAGNDPDVPPDVGDGADDDIVARQIREAAMKEEDPELREKLWDEYRAYKQGRSASDSSR